METSLREEISARCREIATMTTKSTRRGRCGLMKSNVQLITCHDERAHLANVIVSAWPPGVDENHLSDGGGARWVGLRRSSSGDRAIGGERAEEVVGSAWKKRIALPRNAVLDRQPSSWRNAAPISVAPYASRRLASSAPVDSEPCYTTDVGRNVEFYYFPHGPDSGPRSPLNDPRVKRTTTVSRAREYRRALESSLHASLPLSLPPSFSLEKEKRENWLRKA